MPFFREKYLPFTKGRSGEEERKKYTGIMNFCAYLYRKFNDNTAFSCYSGQWNKQDHRSGKERQCCRYIRTVSRIYIARVIFRVRLCPQLIKLNGLFRHALTRPDQVDIWDQVPPCAYWNNQINRSINAETAACPKRQAVFLCGNGEIANEKIFTRS